MPCKDGSGVQAMCAARPQETGEKAMFVHNCWYVAAWDKEVSAEGLLGRTIANVPLVLWRDSAGKVIALEDRCCHRGAKLSMGRKEQGGDCIRCMYHGLVFNRSGQCVSAPAQSHIPPQAKVRSFPVVETHRWISIWMGEPALADPTGIPDTQWLDHPQWRSLDGYLHYDVNYLLIADNLLDFSHLFERDGPLRGRGGSSCRIARRIAIDPRNDPHRQRAARAPTAQQLRAD
jgi:phenylpropionate dioxygenase-like ring-hydroxylating dioxygenase large terminal subunit